jgi:hypothetical protein
MCVEKLKPKEKHCAHKHKSFLKHFRTDILDTRIVSNKNSPSNTALNG